LGLEGADEVGSSGEAGYIGDLVADSCSVFEQCLGALPVEYRKSLRNQEVIGVFSSPRGLKA